MLIILITVLFFEFILAGAIQRFFYKNMESVLTTQLNYSLDYFRRFYSGMSLSNIVLEDIDIFWSHTEAEVQILSLDGKLLMDSLGVLNAVDSNAEDIREALKGEKGLFVGNAFYASSPVMAVSRVIQTEEGPVGILRFVTCLNAVNENIHLVNRMLIVIGVLVVLVSGIISLFLADSIVSPLAQVTKVAEKMANGQLKIQSVVTNEDEIGKLSDTLNYMAKELLKREEIKNEFISSVSHELRTPLTSIKGWAVTLQDEPLGDSPILREGLDIIEKESDRLTGMVEQLLDFSRFVSGRITLEKEVVDMRGLLQRSVSEMTPRAEKYQVSFRVDISEHVGLIIVDENRMKQVIINILDNAVKFSEEGGIIDLIADYSDGVLALEIRDRGIGISEEDLPRVKEKFYKGKSAQSHSGIGLSICDEIIKLHNGTFDIYSRLKEGTVVVIKIPCEEAKKDEEV